MGTQICYSLPLLLLLSLSLFLLPYKSLARKHPNNSHLNSKKKGDGTVVNQCAGRWIYIRPLSPRFNDDLLTRCSDFPILSIISGDNEGDGFCPYTAHHGLGPRTHNYSRSWYRTDPLLLEPLFHRRILEYPCLTSDPSIADAIFVPYYTALDALPYLYSPSSWNSSALHATDLAESLTHTGADNRLWVRAQGHDHFVVAALPAWDLSQEPSVDPPLWGTSFLHLANLLNLTVLVPESRSWSWQEKAIPQPTSFHPATIARLDAWLTRARRSRRITLMLFAGGGGGGGPNIRASIRDECINGNQTLPTPLARICDIVDCSNGVCRHDPIRYMKPMLHSRFCLQPPGDTPTRRATFDGMLAGCIPVFFEERSARAQYGWHLPKKSYEEFSVFIPKEEVVFGGVKIVEVLAAIPAAKVRQMRERVLDLAPRIMYRRHGSSAGLRLRKDAFDIAIDGVLRRIKRRIKALHDPDTDQMILADHDEDDDG